MEPKDNKLFIMKNSVTIKRLAAFIAVILAIQ
jgi:hypothetical protein